jgi:putative transposase
MLEYSKLTNDEREEISRIRALSGYPVHSPADIFIKDKYLFVTSDVYQRQPLINNLKRLTWFESFLLKIFYDYGAELKGWVILQDHFHFLVDPDNFDKIPHIMDEIHHTSSYVWNGEDNALGRKVWDGYLETKIDNVRFFHAALNYIHNNPLKHNLTFHPAEWTWSSLHLYQKDHGEYWLMEKMLEYPFHAIV